MDGIVFFGRHSLDVDSWAEEPRIITVLERLEKLITEINLSGFASVKTPINWHEEVVDTQGFWDKLVEVTNNQKDLMVLVSRALFDGVFAKSTLKSKSYQDAHLDITQNNPNPDDKEYYAALKLDSNWPGVPEELHVQSNSDAFKQSVSLLRKHPIDEVSYALRSSKIFKNLSFHEHFADTLKTHGAANKKAKYGKAPVLGICGFSNAVTKCLQVLNEIEPAERPIQELLREIQALAGLPCSAQGGNKAHLTYNSINCEYHIKISRNNRDDNVFYQDRLYFGFCADGGQIKIFIAHSGQHL